MIGFACSLVVSFAVYSFIGWLWESTVCALLNEGHFANSGFLLGPCCPIYGVGGVLCWLLLHQVANVLELFFLAMLVCTALEYAVGVLLELVTHGQRFWDYSDMPFNIQGRVCLYGALMFGAAAVLICCFVEPAVFWACDLVPRWVLALVAFLIVAVIGLDAGFSIASYRSWSEKVEQIRGEFAEKIDASLAEKSNTMLEKMPDGAVDTAHLAHVRGRAINGWIADFSDAMMDAVKEKVPLPSKDSFSLPSRENFQLPTRASFSLPRFTPGEMRFFDAFPRKRFNIYDAVIKATILKVKIKEKLGRQ